MPESKSGALPLGDIPMCDGARPRLDTLSIITYLFPFGNPFFIFCAAGFFTGGTYIIPWISELQEEEMAEK